MTTEEWRAIPDHAGYEISDAGRVRSLDRVVTRSDGQARRFRGQMMHPSPGWKGYMRVSLGRAGTRFIHTLVLETFVGERPEGMYACHINDDRADNRLSNLRWETPKQNNADAVRNGLNYWANRTHCPRNHPYDAENTRVYKGRRFCRTCKRESYRRKSAA